MSETMAERATCDAYNLRQHDDCTYSARWRVDAPGLNHYVVCGYHRRSWTWAACTPLTDEQEARNDG